jgi:peptidoglycan hydrolase-like protein with peptidoglycan-binding domain
LKKLHIAIHGAAGALLLAGSFGLVCASGFAQTQSKTTATKSTASPSSHSSTSSHSAKTSAKKKTTSSKSARVKMQTAPTADRITEIQSALARASAYTGEPNGKWDASTIAAMQKFQQANGLSPSGKLDALSLQKLGFGSDTAGKGAPRPVAPPTTTATSSTSGIHR